LLKRVYFDFFLAYHQSNRTVFRMDKKSMEKGQMEVICTC